MPGKVFHREIADMITNGCRKTIIILSPDYVQSSWCNYEANLVINRSPGICTRNFLKSGGIVACFLLTQLIELQMYVTVLNL